MKKDIFPPLIVAAMSGSLIWTVREHVATIHARVSETTDVYVLPPASEVVHLSLGYRAALADYLWAHVLVSQGLHTFEKRRFDNLTAFLDTINALDPTFREPYLKTDALITFQTSETSQADLIKAREILERGTRNLPFDGDVWLALGEFLAYEAPSFLKDKEEAQRWRLEGAKYLERAAELGAGGNITWHAIGGANILSKAGERDAAIRFYERVLAITEDEELRQKILKRLVELTSAREAESKQAKFELLRDLRNRELPYANVTTMLVLGPPVSPMACAGKLRPSSECARTWADWFDRSPQAETDGFSIPENQPSSAN